MKFLYHAIRSFDRCSNDYKTALNKRLTVEITLIEAAQFSDDDSPGSGLRPTRRLKPLFKQTDRLQAAATYNATVRPDNTKASTNSTPQQAATRPNTVQPHTPIVTASGQSDTAGRPKHLSIPEALAMVRANNSSKANPQNLSLPQTATPIPMMTETLPQQPYSIPLNRLKPNGRNVVKPSRRAVCRCHKE